MVFDSAVDNLQAKPELLIALEGCHLNYSQTRYNKKFTADKKTADKKTTDKSSADENSEYQPVLTDINLSVNVGETIALIGKSGSGKSTLLKHLRSQLNEKVAWCPQALGLVPTLSVYHNIYMGGLARSNTLVNLSNLLIPNKKAKADITIIAEHLDLSEHLWTSIDQLSGGQQQRTAIGRALFQRKQVLLADEPVSALDDFQSRKILTTLSEQHQTLVLALHDVELAQEYCNRVIGLGNGRVQFDCPSDQIDSSLLAQLYQ